MLFTKIYEIYANLPAESTLYFNFIDFILFYVRNLLFFIICCVFFIVYLYKKKKRNDSNRSSTDRDFVA